MADSAYDSFGAKGGTSRAEGEQQSMNGQRGAQQAGQASGRTESGFESVFSVSSSRPSADPAYGPSPASFAFPTLAFSPVASTSKAILPAPAFPALVDPNPSSGDAGKEWAESGLDEEEVVLSPAGERRRESKLSSPSLTSQRRTSTSTPSRSAHRSSLRTVHPFPLDCRYFSNLQAFHLVKDDFAADTGIKLYSGGGPQPTVFVCADGRSRKKAGDSRTACPYRVVVSKRAQGGYEIDEERSNWTHVGHELKSVDKPVPKEGAAFAGPAEDESTSPAPSTSSAAQPSQSSPLPSSIRQPVSNAFFSSLSSSSGPIANSPPFTSGGLLSSYAQSLAAQVNDQAARSRGQASKKDASMGNAAPSAKANKPVGIEALRRKRARSSISSADVVPDKGKGKQLEETHVLRADIDLTLSADEEEDVKPNLASSSPLPAPTPSKRVKREPSSSSSARRASFAGSSSAALPSSDQHPSFPRPPSIRSVADFLASLEKDKHVGFARLAPYFEAAGHTAQRLEAVEAEDVDDLVQIVMEEATRGRGGPLSGAERHDWNTLGRRMVARK